MFLIKVPTKDRHMLTLNVNEDDEILSIINSPGSRRLQYATMLLLIVVFASFNKASKFLMQLVANVSKLYVTSNFTTKAGNSYSVNNDVLAIKKTKC